MSSKKTDVIKSVPVPVFKRNSGLDENGRELVSPQSMSVAAYMPTLGERIRRYMRTPTLQKDLYQNPDLWDDEDYEGMFYDGEPLSPHDERYQNALKEVKRRKSEKDKADKEAEIEREKKEKEAFRLRVQSAMKSGSIPEKPSDLPPETVDKKSPKKE